MVPWGGEPPSDGGLVHNHTGLTITILSKRKIVI